MFLSDHFMKYLLQVNPLMPGRNKKVTHTETAAGLFKYV